MCVCGGVGGKKETSVCHFFVRTLVGWGGCMRGVSWT